MLDGASADATNRNTYRVQRTSSEMPAKTTIWDRYAGYRKTRCTV